jgi:hypothetical protein
MRNSSEAQLASIREQQQHREVRAHTARVRAALKELPTLIRLEGWNADSDKRLLTMALQEIIGSASYIAEVLEVEL